MEFTKIMLHLIILITAVPVGWFLAKLSKEELVPGKRWFKVIIYSLIIIGLVFFLSYRDMPILLALAYMAIITYMSVYKSKDKKFTSN